MTSRSYKVYYTGLREHPPISLESHSLIIPPDFVCPYCSDASYPSEVPFDPMHFTSLSSLLLILCVKSVNCIRVYINMCIMSNRGRYHEYKARGGYHELTTHLWF